MKYVIKNDQQVDGKEEKDDIFTSKGPKKSLTFTEPLLRSMKSINTGTLYATGETKSVDDKIGAVAKAIETSIENREGICAWIASQFGLKWIGLDHLLCSWHNDIVEPKDLNYEIEDEKKQIPQWTSSFFDKKYYLQLYRK